MFAETQALSFIVTVRRFGLPNKPKLGGFDAIVDEVVSPESALIFLEMPLRANDVGRLRNFDPSSGKEQVLHCGSGMLSQFHLVLRTCRYLLKSQKPRVWMSADVSMAPLVRLLRAVGSVQAWHQHFPDFSPPRSRFNNPVASFLYEKFLRIAWQHADIVTMPGERMRDALSMECERSRSAVIVISNQLPPNSPIINEQDTLKVCNCSKIHILMAVSSTDAEFCIDEALEGAKNLKRIHLLIPGLVTDASLINRDADDPNVTFLGLLSKDQVHQLARHCEFGLALYRADPNAHDNYRDSLKIRMYASLGLPIVASQHVHPSVEAAAAGAAILVDRPSSWVEALEPLLEAPGCTEAMRTAAQLWAESEEAVRSLRINEFRRSLERTVDGRT